MYGLNKKDKRKTLSVENWSNGVAYSAEVASATKAGLEYWSIYKYASLQYSEWHWHTDFSLKYE